MIWTILDRIVNLTFLLLAIIIITMLIGSSKDNMDSNKFELSLVALEDKWVKNAESNLVYVEKRLGALARTQDEYMNSTSVRLDTLEGKVKAFEIENKALKQQQKIYNNNLNINTVNK